MVNKITNKDYCRFYCQKKGNLYQANDAARIKTEIERRKYLEQIILPMSGNTVKKRCQGNYRSVYNSRKKSYCLHWNGQR